MAVHLNIWLLLLMSMFQMPDASLLPNSNPRPVSLAVVAQDSPFNRPKLIGYVIRAINLHRRKVSGFNARGYLRSIQSYSTKEILDAFCNDFFRNNTITLLHINNPTRLPSPPAAVRYIPQLAKSVGIPILSWNPENTMASQVSTTSFFVYVYYDNPMIIIVFACQFHSLNVTIGSFPNGWLELKKSRPNLGIELGEDKFVNMN